MPLAKKIDANVPGTGPVTFRINYGTKKDSSLCVWCNLTKLQMDKRVEADSIGDLESIIYEELARRRKEVTTFRYWISYHIGQTYLPISKDTVEKMDKLRDISFLPSGERLVRFNYVAWGQKLVGETVVEDFKLRIAREGDYDNGHRERWPEYFHDIEGTEFCQYSSAPYDRPGRTVPLTLDVLNLFEDLTEKLAGLVDGLVSKLYVSEDDLLQFAQAQNHNLLSAPNPEK